MGMKKTITFLLMIFCTFATANPALESLQTILEKKTQVKTVSPEIKALQRDYEFIFIYRSDCPHCHRFAPMLDDFAKTHHIPVVAYSVDGASIEPFRAGKLTPELFRTFFLSSGFRAVVPALFLLNRETSEAFPVLFGETQPYQLSERMHEIMKHIREQFNG